MFIRQNSLSWRIEARAKLLEARGEGSSWAYQTGGRQAVEPTALAGLALLDIEEQSPRTTARHAANWLAEQQRDDGSLGSLNETDAPGWPTAHALILWNALGEIAFDSARNRAIAHLLNTRGETMRRDADAVVQHDTTLIGWPWVSGTHSWLEPTATALIALAPRLRGNHPRIVEGARLIQDRAIAQGGWNYGNRLVYDTSLRPQPATTGLALLALASVRETVSIDMNIIRKATERLREMLDRTVSPFALGWGVLGLRAWRVAPSSIEKILARSANLCGSKRDCTPRLACLLLAGAADGLERFGIGRS